MFAWSLLSISISKRISIVKITLNDSKLMSTNIIWFGASNFKIALIASSWSHPFTTTCCEPVHNKSKCCPISSPTCLCECLFTAIIIYAKATHFSALTSKWVLLEKTHQYEYLDCYRKCWNKKFNLNPSNNSNFWEIFFLFPCRLQVHFNLHQSRLFISKCHYVRVFSTQKWVFSVCHRILRIPFEDLKGSSTSSFERRRVVS